MRPVKASPQRRERRPGPRREITLARPATRTHPKRAKAEQLLGKGKTPKQVSVKLGLPYATVYGWSRKLPPAAAPSAAGPSAAGTPRAPRSTDQIREDRRRRDEQAIAGVHDQIDAEARQRAAVQDGQEKPAARRLQPGEKPGTGRKACTKCHILNPSFAKECGSCGKKF